MALDQILRDHVQSFRGLYDPSFEHDGCGTGFVASLKGQKSHAIVAQAITSVCAMVHRGATDADARTGDGAGVLTQLPYLLFRDEIEKLGSRLEKESDLAVGMIFFPREADLHQRARSIIESVLERRKLILMGWREVPIRSEILGEKAIQTCPIIEQVFISKPSHLSESDYEKILFLARREIETIASSENISHFYIPSFSSRTIVYKGLLGSPQLDKFYRDLRNPLYTSAFAIFHQRYSTNTFPTWPLAQCFRLLGHNGEINTIRGNRLWMRAREEQIRQKWGEEARWLIPALQSGGSDSASLDNALELLVLSGRNLLHSMMMLVPQAWEQDDSLSEKVRAFYQYHSCFSEPWDGPAALVFSDGAMVGASLDRNGLRPARYQITSDGLFILSSEVGVLPLNEFAIVEKGRLSPGEMIAVDCVTGKLLRNQEIKETYANRQPYEQWIHDKIVSLPAELSPQFEPRKKNENASLLQEQVAFGLDLEQINLILKPMAETGDEPLGSMGDDAPLAILSLKPRLLFSYFKQLFAQVTNPPIDPIRERSVMSLTTQVGSRQNWLEETPDHARLLHLSSPILTDSQIDAIRQLEENELRSETISSVFEIKSSDSLFAETLEKICSQAEQAVDQRKSILILSDRGIDSTHAALPMLLAVAAVHHHLIKVGKRMKTSLLCESGECREIHHFACLIGYGASAINPYNAWATLKEIFEKKEIKTQNWNDFAAYYRSSVEKGLLKIISKMGISTLASYCGSQLFEAIGLHDEVIARFFPGTSSRLGGLKLNELAQETFQRHQTAFNSESQLQDAGNYRYRREGERHAYSPGVIQNFHRYVGLKGEENKGKPEDYQNYIDAIRETEPLALRHCLKLKEGNAISITEIEPIEEIRRRFTTAGMSLGALSPEAHETLAIAMNRIGGKSNSGEGGEDKARFVSLENGESKNSRIKQIASARFGVTAEYLASAAEIEIKMAQGSKPGEGGQLPGHKVNQMIATLRRSTPEVTLISPPPHHDIYSIEDLAQLIYDLKKVNPRAKICVKLVAEAGVGTIAAGVAKAHADIILISGHDGGTGASPLSSIKNAGAPWELGLAEVQQVLLLNGLRNRVTLRADGGMKTGMDIVIAAILGAEEFNFGTAALIAMGCVYVRQCHLNTCPVGITSQDEKYRAKFKGTSDNVITFFNGVAEEVRQILAKLGFRNLNEIIGQTHLLEKSEIKNHYKVNTLDLAPLLAVPPIDETMPRFHTRERNDKLEDRPLDDLILQDAKSALQFKKPISLKYKIKNTDRSIGAKLSGEIAYQHGDDGLEEKMIDLKLSGSAGQSLGAFLVKGIRLTLIGEANDYVGKSMSGGEIILRPAAGVLFNSSENFICGNTVLYGATGGIFYACGSAGERFAIRNSGAIAVVEGVGDHACEYMTRGTVIILGPTGKNFGAGMSGGIAFVLDRNHQFEKCYNPAMIGIDRLKEEGDILFLKEQLQSYFNATESALATMILKQWNEYQPLFWKVTPHPPIMKAL